MHEGGFSCERNHEGRIEFKNPGGALIARTGYIRALSPVPDISERLRDRYEDLTIDAQTCVTRYDGGGMDWDLAVGALFQ